ncbi:hypothetical protein PORY_001450 [Pneumocystis oryctolagi]|uniref:Uncharacterized protein n=1 Tax=Pneumocystis oryctolagi TaxID=42067 RepID=A0ACB7CD27_9ASCO|nr:hypothetical protein PORY_001450 [Pneumocystis oryctolagi]
MILKSLIVLFLTTICSSSALFHGEKRGKMIRCGSGLFDPALYTCFGNLACPILGGIPYLRCGPSCYSPLLYHCKDGILLQGPEPPEKRLPTQTTYQPTVQPPTPPPTPTYSPPTPSSPPLPPPRPGPDKGKKAKSEANYNTATFGIFCIVGIISFILI